MRNTTIAAIAAIATAAGLAFAAPATAGTYTLELCGSAGESYNAAPGATTGWSTSTAGTTLAQNAAITAWPEACSKTLPTTPNFPQQGTGAGLDGKVSLGSSAMLSYTPPAGTSIVRVQGRKHIFVASGSYAAAGVWTQAGRPLTDLSQHYAGHGDVDSSDADFSAAALGADGAAGIRWGGTCPTVPSDPIVTWCRSAQLSFTDLRITLSDPTPPTASLTGQVNAAGQAELAWTASDPESGIAFTQLTNGWQDRHACNITRAPRCETTVSGTETVAMAEGETRTFTLTVWTPGAGDQITRTLTLTRPKTQTPQPPVVTPPVVTPPVVTPPVVTPPTNTPPSKAPSQPHTPQGKPAPTTTKITVKAKRTAKRLTITGTARGCKNVTITVGGRKKTARVRSGKWKTTTTTKTTRKAKVTAKCGAKRASIRR